MCRTNTRSRISAIKQTITVAAIRYVITLRILGLIWLRLVRQTCSKFVEGQSLVAMCLMIFTCTCLSQPGNLCSPADYIEQAVLRDHVASQFLFTPGNHAAACV